MRRHRLRLLLLAHMALALAAATACTAASGMHAESDTWAVILSSSHYWLNYRHSANALAVYQAVRRCARRLCMPAACACVAAVST